MARTPDLPIPERAYQEIKVRIMAGRFRLRQRLDTTAIAADLGVSTTPVREALLRLTAERLVSFRPSHGFSVAMWSESGLRDLYRWRGELAELALARSSALSVPPFSGDVDYPVRVTALLTALQSGAHGELIACARNADDRLHIARVAERELWPDLEAEWAAIVQSVSRSDANSVRSLLAQYHEKRARSAKALRDCAALIGLPSNGG